MMAILEGAVIALAGYGLLECYSRIKSRFFPKVIFYIEDNAVERLVMQTRFNRLKGFDFKCFSTVKGLPQKLVWSKPAAVIVDQHLNCKVKGVTVYDYCKKLNIPCLIYTGDKKVEGIPKRHLVAKDGYQESFDRILGFCRAA